MTRTYCQHAGMAVLLLLSLTACSSDDDDTPLVEGGSSAGDGMRETTDRYAAIDCSELIPPGLIEGGVLGTPEDGVECGLVTVPADWAAPDGDTIELAVYRVPSTATNPAADPVVYLEGGPGGAGVAIIAEFVAADPAMASAYLRERSEVLTLDQRGTGYSRPALYCPEVNEASRTDGDATVAYTACRDRLVGEGVNFADYNSVNNARDLEAVREALGYERWNLYGLSYGTRLALTAMRDAPARLNSVVLDSVFPPEINGIAESDYPYYFAMEQIGINCAADADCNAAVPDVLSVISAGIARLDANPLMVGDGGFGAVDYLSFLGSEIANPQVVLIISAVANADDASLIELLSEVLGDEGDSEGVEEGVDETAGGDEADAESELPPYDELEPGLWPFVADVSEGMFAAVVCAEEVPFPNNTASPDIAGEFDETVQRVVNELVFDEEILVACQVLNVPAADPIEVQPVTSQVPTLVVAGTADLATPPAWSMLSAESLPNAQYAEFAGLPHGLIGNNACLNGITRAFLDAPSATVDQACIVDLPGVDYEVE